MEHAAEVAQWSSSDFMCSYERNRSIRFTARWYRSLLLTSDPGQRAWGREGGREGGRVGDERGRLNTSQRVQSLLHAMQVREIWGKAR